MEIPVPSVVDLGINVCMVIPYKSLTPASIGTNTSTAHEVVQRHCKHHNVEMWRLVIPGTAFYSQNDGELANPKHMVAIFFRVGKNCLKVMAHNSGSEFYAINDTIYKRVTWEEVGRTGRENGLVAKVNRKTEKSSTYFLKECVEANQEPLRSAIIAGLTKLAFNSSKPI